MNKKIKFSENILVDSTYKHIKLCDFGSSKTIDPNGKNTPYIVSRYYRAPELILCITKYTCSIDIWGKLFIFLKNIKIIHYNNIATGCILGELITRNPLF